MRNRREPLFWLGLLSCAASIGVLSTGCGGGGGGSSADATPTPTSTSTPRPNPTLTPTPVTSLPDTTSSQSPTAILTLQSANQTFVSTDGTFSLGTAGASSSGIKSLKFDINQGRAALAIRLFKSGTYKAGDSFAIHVSDGTTTAGNDFISYDENFSSSTIPYHGQATSGTLAITGLTTNGSIITGFTFRITNLFFPVSPDGSPAITFSGNGSASYG